MSTALTVIEQFQRARRVSVPILAINTPDPASTMQALIQSTIRHPSSPLNPDAPPTVPECPYPLLKWDLSHGLIGLNQTGLEIQSTHIEPPNQDMTRDPIEALRILEQCQGRLIVFLLGAHRILHHDGVIQAIWNLRDLFKCSGATVVLLGTNILIPPDLTHDVITLNEPLPTRDALAQIYDAQHHAAHLPPPSEAHTAQALDALQGLAAFAAEQVIALAMQPTGVEVPQLWARKKLLIDSTPGLRIWNGTERFMDIGGIEGIKDCGHRIIQSKRRPRALIVLDELEKVIAGSAGDGASQSDISRQILGTLLSYMEDHQAGGLLLTGLPGTSKTMFAKAMGAEAGIPTIHFNINEVKGSLLGETERQLRQALDIITAVSQDHALFVATSNAMSSLPPELIRRFTYGTWFFDLPTDHERQQIWKLYRDKYTLDISDPIPDDRQWTGAEIFRCAKLSWEFDISLQAAAQYIVPMAVSGKDVLKRQREQATNAYLSASTGRVYRPDTDIPKSGPRHFAHTN